jgi:hypothetical protein
MRVLSGKCGGEFQVACSHIPIFKEVLFNFAGK